MCHTTQMWPSPSYERSDLVITSFWSFVTVVALCRVTRKRLNIDLGTKFIFQASRRNDINNTPLNLHDPKKDQELRGVQ